MKNRLFLTAIAVMGLSTTTLTSQESTSSVVEPEVVELSDISTFEQTFVHYTKEMIEGTKTTVSQAVDLIVTEGLIITKQYIIFTSISHLIPIIIGFLLIFWLSRKFYSSIGRSKISGAVYNDELEENDEPAFKRPAPLVKILNRYYVNTYTGISTILLTLIPTLLGCFLIAANLMDFIKVTFFSKLYLTELALKYIQ